MGILIYCGSGRRGKNLCCSLTIFVVRFRAGDQTRRLVFQQICLYSPLRDKRRALQFMRVNCARPNISFSTQKYRIISPRARAHRCDCVCATQYNIEYNSKTGSNRDDHIKHTAAEQQPCSITILLYSVSTSCRRLCASMLLAGWLMESNPPRERALPSGRIFTRSVCVFVCVCTSACTCFTHICVASSSSTSTSLRVCSQHFHARADSVLRNI